MILTRTSHQLPAAAGDAPCPAAFSRIGMLDGQSSTTARPSGRKLHWAGRLAALATKLGEKCGFAFFVSLLAVASISQGGGFEITSVALHPTVVCGTLVDVEISLVNTGEETWDPARNYFLSYHWLDALGETVLWEGQRSSFSEAVAPGAETKLKATLKAPKVAGDYRLQWDIVHEGHRWFSQGSEQPLQTTAVRVDCRWAVTTISEDLPSRLWVGSRAESDVEVCNDGMDWSADGDFSIAAHWLDTKGEIVEWEGERTPLPALSSGECVWVTAVIRGPEEPGVYLVQLDLVEDGVCWFSSHDEDIAAPSVVVVVPGPYFPMAPFFVVVLLFAGLVWCRYVSVEVCRMFVWADLVWLGASLFAKQWIIFDQTGLVPGRHHGVLVLAGVGVIVAMLTFVPRRIRPWLSVAVGFSVSVLIFGDLLYQRFFGDLLSLAVWQSSHQAAQVSESVISLVRAQDLWLFADVVLALGLAFFVPRVKRRLLWVGFPVIVVAGLTLILMIGQLTSSSQVFRNVFVAREVGLLNFHVLDLLRGVRGGFAELRLDEQELSNVREFFRQRADPRSGSGAYFGAARSMNLVMIQVESLQAFVPMMRVQGKEVTPTLNRWMRESIAFTNVFDQTEQGRSSDCELLTQASLLPLSSGAAAFVHGDNDFTGLASVLAAEGYHTLSAVPFDPSFWNRRVTHSGFGYEENMFVGDFSPGESIGWGLSDADFLSQMAPKLAALKQPFCAWLITLSLHHPFTGFPEEHKVLDVGRWRGTSFGDYLHTMKFFDDALKDFEAELRASGLLSNTVIVIWGDHDAGFEWTGDIAAAVGESDDDLGWYLSQRVPLMIRVPGIEGGTRDVVAGQVDVAPTLLALMGVDPSPYAFLGRNLLGKAGNRVVTGEYRCWVDETHIFLNRGPRVESGDCLVRDGLTEAPPSECRDGFEEAAKMLEISETVLEFDLQKRLFNKN